jgi:hypothetical protein
VFDTYIYIYIYLCFSYDLGSGPAVLRSLQKVDDGYGHTIEVTRYCIHQSY